MLQVLEAWSGAGCHSREWGFKISANVRVRILFPLVRYELGTAERCVCVCEYMYLDILRIFLTLLFNTEKVL